MILKHMCPACKHSDECHTGRSCSYEWCPCRATTFEPEPTLCPTWDETGTLVETITAPGTKWPTVGRGFTTCACDACQARYAELTREAMPA